MKTTLLLPFLFLWLLPPPRSTGQVNFRQGWQNADPVPKDSILPFEEIIKAHRRFLENAKSKGDRLRQLYGQLYLVYDYFGVQDYTAAKACLLEAENIADQSGDPGWQGWVTHRNAIVASRLKKTEEALREYEKAARLCGEAKDSLCVAESLEQVSIMYGKLDDFENARRVHLIAMPLIEKYGGEAQLGAALNNYGLLHTYQDKPAEAVPYFERSVAIYQKIGKQKEAAKGMNNLADALRLLGRYDPALKLLRQCIRINEENNLLENLRINYANISAVYDSLGDYRATNEFLVKYFSLTDSLIGAETQRKIAELEIKYESQQKELELEKSKSALLASQRDVALRTGVIFFVLLLAAFGIRRWQMQSKRAKKQLSERQKDLADLTQLLLEKNTRLLALEEQASQRLAAPKSATLPEDFETGLFNHSILTDADWSAFKSYFEKAHPAYLLRLRQAFPTITDAEERLFLFIKLNLGTKEAANLLGISVNSVKRNRNRLRHRLGLAEEVELEEFIRSF